MREEKQLLLDEVKEKIENSKGFIIAKYQGFTADRAREFRDVVADAEAEFEVVRKRVFIKAVEAANVKFDPSLFKGHIGIVFAHEDATKASKVMVKYGEANDGAVQVLGGRIDGEILSGEEVETIAKLPSLDELRAQLLSVFEAPMSQTIATLQAALTAILYCLDEKAKKES